MGYSGGGTTGGGGGAAMTPTKVASGDTFTVPADTQVLMAETIELDGDMDIDGVLVEVN